MLQQKVCELTAMWEKNLTGRENKTDFLDLENSITRGFLSPNFLY